MKKFRVRHFAGVLLLVGSCVQAAEESYQGTIPTRHQSPAPTVKQLAQRVVALPAELVGLLFGRDIDVRIEGWSGPLAGLDLPAGSDMQRDLALSGAAHRDTLQLILSESRFRVWLRDDLNLQCDLERDLAEVRSDQFALKVALQFRFR